ncbi:hypothetical protein FBU30_003994 [Linnemannia zychae]|nr:hypothetical protein FBU30_003994 [Linnemannia zychae]
MIYNPDKMSVITETRVALENMDEIDQRYKSSNAEFEDLVRQSLLNSEKYQEQVDNSEPRQQRQKHILSGDLSTNGHDLRVMAYKMTENPGIASTATATLIHSCYEKDNLSLKVPCDPRDNIDKRYHRQQSCLKLDAGITEIESRLVQRKLVEAKLLLGDLDVTMESDSGIISKSADTITLLVTEKAMEDYESAVRDDLINQAKDASILRSFYGSIRFKQDLYGYREAQRHDLDKVTTAIQQMRKHVPEKQPSKEDFDKVLFQLDDDLKSSMAVVNGMSNVKEYNWTPYLRLMDEANKLTGMECETPLKSKMWTRRRNKIARSLYKRGFIDLNALPDDKRNAILQPPLVIGLGDGDFRNWRRQIRGGSEFTRNLIRRSKKKTPPVIELVKIPEFRASIFCCSCHFRMKVRGRSVICDECNWERDRDHKAATNMSNAVLQFLRNREWPAPLDYERAKLVDQMTCTVTEDFDPDLREVFAARRLKIGGGTSSIQHASFDKRNI